MAVILLEKDPFVEQEAQVGFGNAQNQQYNIRRPLYGLSIKEPRHAFLSMYQDGGSGSLVPISMKDSSAPGGWSNANHNIILTDVQESRQEKVQIMETFGDHFAFFYGEKPIVLTCSAMLINTEDFNWKNEWFYNYNNFLRGTKCVENRARVFLGYDDVLVQGYILGCQTQLSKDMPNICPLSFQMLLAKEPLDLSPAGDDFVGAQTGASVYVQQAGDARFLPDGRAVEYIGTLQGLFGGGGAKYSINPVTGDSEEDSGFGPNVPDAVDDPRTAFWLSERDPRVRQWRTPDEALLELNTKVAAQQAGVDEVTARQVLRASPGTFQLAARSESTTSVANSLTKGVANSATVISDTTGLE